MRFSLLALILCLVTLPVVSQPALGTTIPADPSTPRGSNKVSYGAPTVSWNQSYGTGTTEEGYDLVEVSAGGFAVLGWQFTGGRDAWLVRTDQDGNALWDQTYGGDSEERGASIVELSGGGFAFTGWTGTYGNGGGYHDVWLVRTDASGNALWNQTFGGSSWDRGQSIIEVSGGFAIAGYFSNVGSGYNEAWLIRTDASGNHQWDQSYGSGFSNWGYDVVECSSGGFAIVGVTNTLSNHYDVILIRTDASGNHLWNVTFGGTEPDLGFSLVEVSSGGFAIAGYTESSGAGNADLWLIRTDASGNHLWNLTYDGGFADEGSSILEQQNGHFVLTGLTRDSRGFGDVLLIGVDANGSLLWSGNYDGIQGYEDWGSSVIECSGGGFAIAGYTDSTWPGEQLWLLRLGSVRTFGDGISIPGFPVYAIVLGLTMALGLGLVSRRRRRE